MADGQQLKIEQRTRLRLSQQQLRFVRLLELSAPELEDAVEVALEENPALEAVDPSAASSEISNSGNNSIENGQNHEFLPVRKYRESQSSEENREWERWVADDDFTLYDYLNDQLSERRLTPEIDRGARFIIGSLDSNGYLTRTEHQIANDIATGLYLDLSDEQLNEALRIVRSLEPHGVGARNLQDCLLLQLESMKKSQRRDDAIEIVRDYFDELTKKHIHKILLGLQIGNERINKAMDLILGLNPKPGASIGTGIRNTARSIIPDFTVNVEDGKISIQINNSLPELRIEESFETAVRELSEIKRSRKEKQARDFVMLRYNDAKEFISVLKQRQETLFAVMTAIVKLQKDYFLTEDVHKLRPMMIKDISAETGFDYSVVSRATHNKYLSTPWGIFPLRFFFSDSLGKEGEEFTQKEVENELEKIIGSEDKTHPLSDASLQEKLKEKGYEISRRTVAKYRDRLKIPVARLRKDINLNIIRNK